MAKLSKPVNYTKLVYQAKKTKMDFPASKKKAYETWQKKLGSKSSRLDRIDQQLRKALQDLAALQKSKDDKREALENLLGMIHGAFKELKVYKQVPVKETLPPLPKNVTGLQSMAVVLVAMIAYVGAVKAYMAFAEALTSKDK